MSLADFNDADFGTFDEVVSGALSDRTVLTALEKIVRRRTGLSVTVHGGGHDGLVVTVGDEKRIYNLTRPSLFGSLFRR